MSQQNPAPSTSSGDVPFFDQDADVISNVVVSSEPGIGTFAALQREIAAKKFNALTIPAAQLHQLTLSLDLSHELAPAPFSLDQINEIDTLVIDDAADLLFDPDERSMVGSIVNTRTAFARPLPQLKRVVLFYVEFSGRPSHRNLIQFDGRYPASLITRVRTSDRSRDGRVSTTRTAL